jgi:hypothetical protein
MAPPGTAITRAIAIPRRRGWMILWPRQDLAIPHSWAMAALSTLAVRQFRRALGKFKFWERTTVSRYGLATPRIGSYGEPRGQRRLAVLYSQRRPLMWKQTDKSPFRDVTINYFKWS